MTPSIELILKHPEWVMKYHLNADQVCKLLAFIQEEQRTTSPIIPATPRTTVLPSPQKLFTYPQKLTLCAFELDRTGKPLFSQDDLRTALYARQELPKNLARDLQLAIKAGYIEKSTNRLGTYQLTQAGRTFAESAAATSRP